MGLFWSMQRAPGQPYGMRVAVSNAAMPLVYDVTLYRGHLDLEQTYAHPDLALCNCRIRRWYMGKGVQKIPVHAGRVRGTLFLPPGAHAFFLNHFLCAF